MNKAQLKALIQREILIQEQIGPYNPNKRPKKPTPNVSSVDANNITTTTPILGYNCTAPAGASSYCQPIYDIPQNQGYTPSFATLQECYDAKCGG
tara:strand:+ start:537 stop:821 length:285 start_codon:yes stop_codon:yes gene_type:complete